MNTDTTSTFSTPEEFRDQAHRLAHEARRELLVYSPVLEPEIYNAEEFISAVMDLVQRSRHARVRLLAADTRHLLETCHRLLGILRITEQQLELRRFQMETAAVVPAYIIADDNQMLRRQNASLYNAIYYVGDRARIKEQIEDFEQQWRNAYPDPNLRQLSL